MSKTRLTFFVYLSICICVQCMYINLYVYKGTNTVHIFLSLFLVCLLCFETLHRRNWTAHPKKWDFTKIDPTNKPKQHPPRVKETIRFTAGLPSPLFPSLTFWGFNSPNWEQVILLYVEKICQSIKLPMLQHVYPKCSSKLPQQLTSNCPGRSGLEVHVAPTSAFSINDLRWLALNIKIKMIWNFTTNVWNTWPWNFIPSVFSVFFNHQRYPTLHRPVAYLQAWSRPPINTEGEIPRSLLFTKDWYGLVTFPTYSTKIGWNQLISKWFNVSKQTYKQTWNHWKSPEKSITSSRSRYPLDAARSMIFVSSFHTSNTSRSFFGVWGEGRVYGSDVGRGLASRKSGWQRHISIWKEPQKAWWCAMPAVMRKL